MPLLLYARPAGRAWLPFCEHTTPSLTSIRQPIYQIAADALEMLVKLIRGERVEPRTRLYTPALDIRASCGASEEAKL